MARFARHDDFTRELPRAFMSGRRQSRHPRRGPPAALDLVEECVRVGGRRISLLRPRVADALLDEEAFEHEEFLPYWAELWPSAIALAQEVVRLEVDRLRVLELGCGLGLPSIVAALGGAHVLATDWSPDAVEVAARNAERNGAELETALAAWGTASALVDAAPWDLVIGADLLYERRNVEQLLVLLPRLGDDVLLSEPGRPFESTFLERARKMWAIDSRPAGGRVRIHRLRRG
jgi:predicted nicotinamide N-methyase